MASMVTTGFVLKLAADLSVIPSIYIMQRNKRHFELFIGLLHVFVAVCFNCAQLTTTNELFLTVVQWHAMLEVLYVSFLYLLCVHLLALPYENVNITLRYLGFALAWIVKVKDGQFRHTHSLLLVAVAFSAVVLRRLVVPGARMLPLHRTEAMVAALLAAFCTAVFFLHPSLPIAPTNIESLFYICLGGFFFAGWKSVPPPELASKKFDDCDIVFSEYN
ncbi:hypothetical protein SPRG_00271 [Saprolegnia parasitica CBS 223.65]|uniref:Uncharacterized protein n=1 Tax=Saprolegnia parasitica (strain CBS 223.65) TaxID=695850 RepID=A0A067CY35_SAPPC|nr:hypothetical protein SPRG_00271 [Saprolegnia parasitica CBS 223.65]KDO35423.1 hypothetical protein SPRG_00271 [Saprolegnia parasitica CBS 223.65]|eukprot:XP_012193763.1 hypothetical protein SPRG_00271 [Saprolegnia parasitica CBS 223.65]